MLDKKLLSIIIPTYNRYDLVKGTLESLINQLNSFNLFEKTTIIVADNASEGKLPKSLMDVIHLNNCTYFRNETNIGITRNILKAFELVRSEYLWIFGDDDLVDDFLIQKLEHLLKNIDLIQIRSSTFFEEENIIFFREANIEIGPLLISKFTIKEIDSLSGFITSNIIRVEKIRQVIDLFLSDTEGLSLDNNYFVKAMNFMVILNSKNCYWINSSLVYQRVSNTSHFHQSTELIFKTFFKDQFDTLDYIMRFNPSMLNIKRMYQNNNITNILILRLFHKNSKGIGREILLIYDRPNLINRILCLCPKNALLFFYKIYKAIKGTPYPIQFEKLSESLLK